MSVVLTFQKLKDFLMLKRKKREVESLVKKAITQLGAEKLGSKVSVLPTTSLKLSALLSFKGKRERLLLVGTGKRQPVYCLVKKDSSAAHLGSRLLALP